MSKHVEERGMHEMKNTILSFALPLLLALAPASASAARLLWVSVGGSVTIVDGSEAETAASLYEKSGKTINALRVTVSDASAPGESVPLVFAYEDEFGSLVTDDPDTEVRPLDFTAGGAAWAPLDLFGFTDRSLIVTMELGYAPPAWDGAFEPLAVASETLGNLLDAPHVSVQSDLNPPAMLPWAPERFLAGWTVPAIQRANGACEDISVSPADLASIGLAGLSGMEAISNALNTVQSNGCRAWENLVLGNLATNLLVADVSAFTAGGLLLDLPAAAPTGDFGYDVLFDLRRSGATGGSLGSGADPTVLEIPLYPNDRDDVRDPSGLYRIVTLLVPETNPSVTNEIVSTNAIGVLKVTSALTNTVTAVPWTALAGDPAFPTNVPVSEVLHPANLSDGDRILAWNGAAGRYDGWELSGAGAWQALTAATIDGVSVAEGASDRRFAPGSAFWLVRGTPVDDSGAAKPAFLYGQWLPDGCADTVGDGSAAAPATILCANPTPGAVLLSEIAFEGGIGNDDTIVVTADDGVPTIYVRRNGAWGYWQKKVVGRRVQSVWVEDGAIAPGTGFWYVRRTSGDLTIRWPAVEE